MSISYKLAIILMCIGYNLHAEMYDPFGMARQMQRQQNMFNQPNYYQQQQEQQLIQQQQRLNQQQNWINQDEINRRDNERNQNQNGFTNQQNMLLYQLLNQR